MELEIRCRRGDEAKRRRGEEAKRRRGEEAKRMQAAWDDCRRVLEVLCDKRVNADMTDGVAKKLQDMQTWHLLRR